MPGLAAPTLLQHPGAWGPGELPRGFGAIPAPHLGAPGTRCCLGLSQLLLPVQELYLQCTAQRCLEDKIPDAASSP